MKTWKCSFEKFKFYNTNSDLIICVGCKLDIITAFNPKNFAPKAKKIFVNIDKITYKNLKVPIDLFFENDAKDFLEDFKNSCKKNTMIG